MGRGGWVEGSTTSSLGACVNASVGLRRQAILYYIVVWGTFSARNRVKLSHLNSRHSRRSRDAIPIFT